VTASNHSSNTDDDVVVIEQIVQGNQQAFTKLVTKYHRLVRVIIWNFFGKSIDPEDIMQEIFLQAYLNISKLKERAKFKSWLLRIAYNECVDSARKNRPASSGFSTEDLAEKGIYLEDVKAQDQFSIIAAWNLLANLASEDRTIVWLKYVEDCSYSEIFAVTGISETVARKKASRAMQILRERIKI